MLLVTNCYFFGQNLSLAVYFDTINYYFDWVGFFPDESEQSCRPFPLGTERFSEIKIAIETKCVLPHFFCFLALQSVIIRADLFPAPPHAWCWYPNTPAFKKLHVSCVGWTWIFDFVADCFFIKYFYPKYYLNVACSLILFRLFKIVHFHNIVSITNAWTLG